MNLKYNGSIIIVKEDDYNELVSENDRLRRKRASLVQHLTKARAAGYYDYENTDYGGVP